jgi:DNA-binding beta-propeller fold protein YncE
LKTVKAATMIGIACAFLCMFSAGASADQSFCPPGVAAGQCERPVGVAVDQSNGHVYVVDTVNNRVNVFDSAGGFTMAFGWGVADGATNAPQTCTTTCFKGLAGSGSGQFAAAEKIAIDSDPGSPSYRDVYVLERNNSRVQKFSPTGEFILMFGGGVNKTTGGDVCTAASGNQCGAGSSGDGNGEFDFAAQVAAGPGGTVYVADTGPFNGHESARVQKFESSGAFVAKPVQLDELSQTNALASNSLGEIYLGTDNLGTPDITSIHRFKADGTSVETTPVEELVALAVDPADDLYAAQSEGNSRVITEFDSSGAVLTRFGYGAIKSNIGGIAPYHSGSGEIFATEPFQEEGSPKVLYLSFPPPGPLPCCIEASPVGNTKATLRAKINPEGKTSTYRFDYVDQASFETSEFSGPNVKTTGEIPFGSDATIHQVSAEIGCKEPQVPPQAGCLAPETKYRFRLVTTNADGVNEEVGPAIETQPPLRIVDTFATEIGPDAAQLHATVNPLGVPATAYFEFVDDDAFNASGFASATLVPDVAAGSQPLGLGSGEADKTVGVQLTSLAADTTYHYRVVAQNPFTTPSGLLGPERIFHTTPAPVPTVNPCPNQSFRTGPSATLPNCRAYEMVTPIQKGNGDIAVRLSGLNFPAALDQSSSDGDSFSYSSEKSFGDAISAPYTSQYVASRKEGEAWSSHGISPSSEGKSLNTFANARFDLEYKNFAPDLASGWLAHNNEPALDSCAPSGFLNLYRRDGSGGYEALTTAAPSNRAASTYWPELQGVSADGTHAIFRANGKLTPNAPSLGGGYQLYEHVSGEEGCGELRLVSILPNGKASTLESAAGSGNGVSAEGRGNILTGAISEDGSRIFWMTAAEPGQSGALYVRIEGKETVLISAGPAGFWDAAADGSKVIYGAEGSLYEFDVGSKTQTLIAAGSRGVVATSKDASRVYFVSTKGQGGEGKDGLPNLFLREGGTNKLVATLSSDDDQVFSEHVPLAIVGAPYQRGVRATPDGRHLAFLSSESLTGYDNKDAEDGQRVVELFIYDMDSGKVNCVSCNPSGARPVGREFLGNQGVTRRLAALMPAWENQLYAPRALSDAGNRLFFDSFEALVPRDSNGKEDVYEWERANNASECKEQGAELFVGSSGGCLSLISSGQSPTDSELDDASPDGTDVFIKTASSLVPQDPGLVDIYDARVGGGLPAPPEPAPSCEGEACQGPLSAPNDPTPASTAFQGAGNLKDGSKRNCPKGKAKRKGRCVSKSKKHAKHAKRASHKGRAGR